MGKSVYNEKRHTWICAYDIRITMSVYTECVQHSVNRTVKRCGEESACKQRPSRYRLSASLLFSFGYLHDSHCSHSVLLIWIYGATRAAGWRMEVKRFCSPSRCVFASARVCTREHGKWFFDRWFRARNKLKFTNKTNSTSTWHIIYRWGSRR